MIYLLISALLILGLFFCLKAARLDVIAISFYIGVARVMTLRTIQTYWADISSSGCGSIRYTVLVTNDYYFLFLLLSLISIGIYAALTLVPEHASETALTVRYLTGFLLVGVGGYLSWMQADKFASFYAWDKYTWNFGHLWGILIFFLGIGLSTVGFWLSFNRRKVK